MERIRLSSQEEEPFRLNKEILDAYPEMQHINGLPQKEATEALMVSAIFSNGRTIDAYIKHIKVQEPTGNVEYHIELIEKNLQKLSSLNKSEFSRFIETETAKLEKRKQEFKQAIDGWIKKKRRGKDGVYR